MRDFFRLQFQLRIAPIVMVAAVWLTQRFAIDIDTDQVVLALTAVFIYGYDVVKVLLQKYVAPRLGLPTGQ